VLVAIWKFTCRALVSGRRELHGLGGPIGLVIHVGTNDLRRTGNLDYVMGDVYGHVNMAETNFSKSRIFLSGVLRRRDVSWRHRPQRNDHYGM
jgi:hypothetical protein